MKTHFFDQLKSFGPGLLFAGAAVGVSHLVQSTRAGADFGFGLLWALLIVNLFKYPFIQYGSRYAIATGESLIDGYAKLGRGLLWFYFVLTLLTMFTIQVAVTIVTAGLAENLFHLNLGMSTWSLVITLFSFLVLLIGKYALLDKLMKLVILTLTISTIASVVLASFGEHPTLNLKQVFPFEGAELAFLITFMGWMPAPLDVSVWQSLWTIEKRGVDAKFDRKKVFFDFNIGYITTVFLGICFVALGALVMYHSGETFSSGAGEFAQQLINMYTQNLGSGTTLIIATAAFTTMFSTTLTTLDASPRSMARTTELLLGKAISRIYLFWIVVLVLGTGIILHYFLSNMATLVKIATVISFLTAPFYAISNLVLIKSKYTPDDFKPGRIMELLSYVGIAFLIGFSVWYLIQL